VVHPNIKTLADLPFHIAERFPRRAILRHCRGDSISEISGSELLEQIRNVSAGLRELGLATGERVAVIAESRPEWCVSDLAVLTAGGVTDRFATSSVIAARHSPSFPTACRWKRLQPFARTFLGCLQSS
jgi:long-subunit acyl-CoA synthetase (AMP-forming)